MKTITIKQADIASLDSDESKLKFINSIIALLSGSEIISTDISYDTLSGGLNADIPEPMEGAPDFDSSNMNAPEFRRYSLLRAGYVPKNLNCGYSRYEYIYLGDLSYDEIDSLWDSAISKIKLNWKKRDYGQFLKYLCEMYTWYFQKTFCPPK